MKKIRYFIMLALCAIGITSCQDDLTTGTAGADVNKPVKVDLKFGIPKSMRVEVTRADNSYSDMYSVWLYVFSGNTLVGNPQNVSTANGLVKGQDTDTGQYYTAQNVTLYEGTQEVYAIGNADRTGYWNSGTLESINNAAKQGKLAFEAALYSLASTTIDRRMCPSFSTDYMPLSGVGTVKVDNGQSIGVVNLRRLVAQIKFKINTEYSIGDKKVTFEPSNYAFYNVASTAYVLDGTNKSIVSGNVYDTDPVNIEGAGENGIAEFSVFIPENIQNVKNTETKCSSYNDRESFTGTGNNKNWTYAADNSTYVVIKGVCKETSDGTLSRYGNVEYTIHLGDFSSKGSYDNFSVERNSIYTYTVTVQGMEKIKVEAERVDDDYQNGAEGNVIELGDAANMFSLDAHYEQVYVEYNLSNILRSIQEQHPVPEDVTDDELKEDIANHFLLVIHTPMNTVSTDNELRLPYSLKSTGNEEEDMSGIDYKWIEFYPQSETDAISLYPGVTSSSLYSPYEVCRMMGEAIFQLYKGESPSVKGLILSNGNNNDLMARFTIFVNEYFYKEDLAGNPVAWDKFTRQDPRTMMIASNMKISEDLNSTYSTAQTYITQRSIETFYNPTVAGTENALGMETYNEYGLINSFGSSASSDDWADGRTNMLINLGILKSSNSSWTTMNWGDSESGFIDFTQIGYKKDNSGMNHIWEGYAKTVNAYYACLSRNRDLNGNKQIDPDEVRWYLPALSQYLRMGIGTRALPSETQLYTGQTSTLPSGNGSHNYLTSEALADGALYFVNTSDPRDGGNYTFYWAVEVGAYGSPGNRTAMVRCVRNLPSQKVVESATNEEESLVDKKALAGPIYGELKAINYGDNKNAVFDFENKLVTAIYRNSEVPQYGAYRPHNENDDYQMRLPRGFVVSSNPIAVSDVDIAFGIYTRGSWSYGDDPCLTYTEKSDGSDLGYWRTPNLNELMVMSTVNDEIKLNTKGRDNSYNVFSRTQFSNTNVRPGFYFNYSNMITTNANELSKSGYVRCVRDVTTEDLQQVRSWN